MLPVKELLVEFFRQREFQVSDEDYWWMLVYPSDSQFSWVKWDRRFDGIGMMFDYKTKQLMIFLPGSYKIVINLNNPNSLDILEELVVNHYKGLD